MSAASFTLPVASFLNSIRHPLKPFRSKLVPRLGILAVNLNEQLRSVVGSLRVPSGVVVIARAANLIGPETGLKTGDIIHTVNTTSIDSLDSLRTVMRGLNRSAPIVLQVERDGQLQWLAFEME